MEEEQFGFRKGKRYKRCNWIDSNNRRKIYIEKDKDVYAVFIDREKAFYRVDWKKLMGFLMKIVVDWKERGLSSNHYMKQRIKVRI